MRSERIYSYVNLRGIQSIGGVIEGVKITNSNEDLGTQIWLHIDYKGIKITERYGRRVDKLDVHFERSGETCFIEFSNTKDRYCQYIIECNATSNLFNEYIDKRASQISQQIKGCPCALAQYGKKWYMFEYKDGEWTSPEFSKHYYDLRNDTLDMLEHCQNIEEVHNNPLTSNECLQYSSLRECADAEFNKLDKMSKWKERIVCKLHS